MFTVTALLVKKVTRSVRKILGGGNVQAQKIINHVAAKMNRIENENISLVFGYIVRLKVKTSKGTRSPLYFTLRFEARHSSEVMCEKNQLRRRKPTRGSPNTDTDWRGCLFAFFIGRKHENMEALENTIDNSLARCLCLKSHMLHV